MARVAMSEIRNGKLGLVDPERLSQPVSMKDVRRWEKEDQVASVAEAVLEIRERLGLTQQGIANILGVPVGTWRNWEQGRRQPDPATKALLCILRHEPEAALRALSSQHKEIEQ